MPSKAPKHAVDHDRLCDSIKHSRQSLRFYREQRKELVRQYVGHNWSEESTREKVPVNLISQYCQIVIRSLIAKNPRVMLSTFNREAQPTVSAMERWANDRIKQMHLAVHFERMVLDALFSVGICKTALAMPADSASVGWHQPVGQPFSERVSLDDFVCDMHARDFMECGYIGHRFRAPREVIAESNLYNRKRKDLPTSFDQPFNAEGDERAPVLGRSYYDDREFEDYADLWEIYVPRKKLILTFADNMGTPDAALLLREVEWLGPDTGPYRFLCFRPVPDNCMPKGPVQDLRDLHLSINRITRKLLAQAERQKEVLLVRGSAAEDGNRIIKASDGEGIMCDDPSATQMSTFGGPNQANFLLFQEFMKVFSQMAGNLDMMGGLAPQSRTLGQDKLLAENASGTMQSMQETAHIFFAGVIEDLCWFWHHHPTNHMRSRYEVPGLPNHAITRTVTPQQRQKVSWQDMQVNVDPYSYQGQTPQQRLAALKDMMTSIVLPLAPLLQQQGIMVDLNFVIEKMGRYMDDPDVQQMFSVQAPPQPEGQGGQGQAPGMPQTTTRNYNRSSTAGSPQDKAMQNTNAMRSGSANGQVLNPSMGSR